MQYTITLVRAENGWILNVVFTNKNLTRIWIAPDIPSMQDILNQIDDLAKPVP